MAHPYQTQEPSARWYRGVERYAWLVLAIAALGWLFDTMDQSLFNLVRQVSLTDLLRGTVPSSQLPSAVSSTSGVMTAVFLLGWAAGGFLFGMLGDRLGRVRTLAYTILIYAVFTGLTGLSHTLFWYGVCRFLTALGVGGEFAAGASLVAEVFPERSRPLALGLLQTLSAVGTMSAAVVNLSLSGVPDNWRWAYAVGALPALLVLMVRVTIREPERWKRARDEAESHHWSFGSIAGLIQDPNLRRNTIAGSLLALAGVGGLWGIGAWLPELTTLSLSRYHFSPPEMSRVRSLVFLVQQAGALIGMFAYAPLSQRWGRKPAMLLFFVLAFAAVEATFHFLVDLPTAYGWGFVMGLCTHAPFAAYAVYFPELFPTRLRATGIGFCYNGARVLAAAAPFTLGKLAGFYQVPDHPAAGLRSAASIVAFVYFFGILGLALAPETRGLPLPE